MQIPLPEEPDTEDETVLKKWKWKVKAVKKENRERHSQRCDIELKLAVGFNDVFPTFLLFIACAIQLSLTPILRNR